MTAFGVPPLYSTMNWKTFNLRTKLLLGVGILVAGYVASVTVGFITGAAQERELAAVGRVSVPVSLKCQAALFEFEASAKAFTDASMTGDEAVLKETAARNVKTVQILGEIAQSASSAGLSAEELRTLGRQLSGLDATRAEVFKGLTTADATAREAARKKAEALAAATDQVRQQLTKLCAFAAAQLDARLAANTASSRQQRYANLVLAGIVITLGCATLILIIQRSVVGPVRRVAATLDEGATQVAASAGQVSAASQSLAEGSSEQAASLE
jgi:hypothetical protein